MVDALRGDTLQVLAVGRAAAGAVTEVDSGATGCAMDAFRGDMPHVPASGTAAATTAAAAASAAVNTEGSLLGVADGPDDSV